MTFARTKLDGSGDTEIFLTVSNHDVEALIVPMITEQGKVEVNVAIREHM